MAPGLGCDVAERPRQGARVGGQARSRCRHPMESVGQIHGHDRGAAEGDRESARRIRRAPKAVRPCSGRVDRVQGVL